MRNLFRVLSWGALLLPLLLTAEIPQFTEEGFRVPQPGAALAIPDILAGNPDYKIEWWYLTGHLYAENRRFGYQATFFRYALLSPEKQESSDFGLSHLHLTHMALTDEAEGDFHYQQRLHRAGWDAGASTSALDVRHGNWSLRALEADASALLLRASIGSSITWELELRPLKPLVRFGPDGTSRKGPAPESRSYYLSFTRLQTQGTLRIGDSMHEVTGMSWMDHEIASSQLDPSYQGWDWIAIQLDDGWEVKAYLLRDADNQPSEFSALIWISPEGTVTYRGREDFVWEKPRFWQSPQSGAHYPQSPVVHSVHPETGKPVVFRFEPLLPDQELNLPGTIYWEGAGRIFDLEGAIIGSAYLELVGYAGPIEGLR